MADERIVTGFVDNTIELIQKAPTLAQLDSLAALIDRHERALSSKDRTLLTSAVFNRRQWLERQEGRL